MAENGDSKRERECVCVHVILEPISRTGFGALSLSDASTGWDLGRNIDILAYLRAIQNWHNAHNGTENGKNETEDDKLESQTLIPRTSNGILPAKVVYVYIGPTITRADFEVRHELQMAQVSSGTVVRTDKGISSL